MLFGHHLIDKTYDEHLADIASLAADPKTLVFLDTNIIAYLYKLHAAARLEFLRWTDALVSVKRLSIPAWSAGEYLSRVTTGQLQSYSAKSKDPEQTRKSLDGMLAMASLFVDDAILKKVPFVGDRGAFLAEFKTAIESLSQFLKAFNHQHDPATVHAQILKHLSPAILDSDLAALCRRAAAEGPVRFEHRLPPGHRDDIKPENRFGDLIIWFEIIDRSMVLRDQFSNTLFVTNDEKKDWVYPPQQKIAEARSGERKPVPNRNPEIKLADPRLVSEFRRVVGHANITLCSLSTLIEAMSKKVPELFVQLAGAIQINSDETRAAVDPLASAVATTLAAEVVEITPEEKTVQPSDVGGVAQDQFAADVAFETQLVATAEESFNPDALCDSEYDADPPLAINEIIRALKSLNWYTQNPAVGRINELRQESFDPSAWFVLGRNIYQAACGNSQKAMEFIQALESQLSRFPSDTANHLLSGMVFEMYFDSHGKFRSEAKFLFAEKVLFVVAMESFAAVRDFIRAKLEPHRRQLLFAPGDTTRFPLCFVSAPDVLKDGKDDETPLHALHSLTLGNIELVRYVVVDETDAWARMLHRRKLTADDVVQIVSRSLAIPRWAIQREFAPPVRPDVIFLIEENQEIFAEAARPKLPN